MGSIKDRLSVLFESLLHLTLGEPAVVVFVQLLEELLEFLDIFDRDVTLELVGELLAYLPPLVVVKLVFILIQFDGLNVLDEFFDGLRRLVRSLSVFGQSILVHRGSRHILVLGDMLLL